jgi:tRNA A-37 threonylcarbamoyl transferase component Bud32
MDPVYLTHLPKHGRGRTTSQTFRASCAAGDKTGATAWLTATETLKGPDDAAYDAFVHVMKGLLRDNPVVIKLQEVGRLSEREARIATVLSRHAPPNVVVPICEFKCKNDFIEWKQPLTSAKQFCSGKTDTTSVFVMEYIPHNLIEFLSVTPVTAPVYRSILKQLGFALANLHSSLKMTHGDIGSGNLMLEITDSARIIQYTIGGQVFAVDTLGYEPILIDFQRSAQYSGQPDYGMLADEIAMTFDVIARWAKEPPFSITSVVEEFGETTRMSDILRLVTNI